VAQAVQSSAGPLIEVRGLTKLYRMGSSVVHALDGVDMSIERGEFVAITGPSGSGKSTMMHLLGCLDRPTGGTYILDGRPVSDLSDRELAAVRNRQIGFVFQTFNLINRTSATENVSVPLFYARKTNTRTPALRALERVGLVPRAHHNPNELSGGERQRVAIARAIVNDPALLLADEPTGNLDSHTGEQIMDIFRRLNEQGVTVVMVTHEPDIARQARRIIYMLDGKIVADRSAAEVVAAAGAAAPRKWTSDRSVGPPCPTDQSPSASEGPDPNRDREGAVIASRSVGLPCPTDQSPSGSEGPYSTPDAQPPPAGPRILTARLMRGANAALTLGILAVGLWVVTLVGQRILQAQYPGFDPQHFDPAKRQMPPFGLVIGGLVGCVGMVAAVVLAILAIVLGIGARKRIRTEPGHWLGGRRALAGMILGWAAIGLPAIWVVVGVVRLLTHKV
jgi:putative ABC transport system ATP-binding protein